MKRKALARADDQHHAFLNSRTFTGEGTQTWPERTDPDVALSIETGRAAIDSLTLQNERLESVLLKRMKLSPEFQLLQTVTGIGAILAMTIALEAGSIARVPSVGEFTSYCRCVNSQRLSNAKKMGEANRKNGIPRALILMGGWRASACP